jgi:hypothetical protein
MEDLMSFVKLAALFAFAIGFTAVHAEDIVEFHIPAGTNNQAYNTLDTALVVNVGQTLRVYNDDSVAHRVHTNGIPCAHGDTMAPGGFWDCNIESVHSAKAKDIYDHNFGPNAQFYIEAISQ